MTNLVTYIESKKKENSEITSFHAFVRGIAKVLYNRPKLNRFIANRHVYEHNEIIISFVAKLSFDDSSEEVMIMIPINENDNINTISKKIKEKVSSFRNKKAKKETSSY